ncbi:4Fe-4S binding protein [Halarsenatibacter silvermanii]|uniref:Ferredoxin n=1 Tax=Halarsenatibacter silvermanii TaxID=321763 RepID=A0A1G9T889_9FIRM|nr:4Fe-4S dicluster domain-containing protein [Halarsenatibacter silvermanii]SDM43868.1 4Fe-4S dicluster domain-containing protein [Halarsenatibacter silvermanii]
MILVGAGVISSFFLSEDFWHRVCPHGTVLYVSSSPAKFKMNLDEDLCTGCGLCEQACPSGAITSYENSNIRKINNNECLTCHDCEDVCPVNAINYSA